ncbi:MAG: hypothetical protein V4591_07295 [Bdellovibrionota bacterium]
MKIVFISGDGHGAGKTYLARKFTNGSHQIFSIANTIRFEISQKYKNYAWYNKSPEYKDNTIVKETNKTIREMLDEFGRNKKAKKKLYWAIALANSLIYAKENDKLDIVVIDDLRFVDEMRYIKDRFPHDTSCHFHVINPKAVPEPHYENERLRKLADYFVSANRSLEGEESAVA